MFPTPRLPLAALLSSLLLPAAALAQTAAPAAPMAASPAPAAPAQATPAQAMPAQATPAQATPAPQRPAHAMAHHPHRAPSADQVEMHIQRLHAQLQITAAEQPQWDAFAQVMRDNAKHMQDALQQRSAALGTMNAADNMRSYAKLAQQHAEDMQKLSEAFQALYTAMPDGQKKVADQVFQNRVQHPKHH